MRAVFIFIVTYFYNVELVSSCDSLQILDITKLDGKWTCYATSSNPLFPCQDSFDGDLFTYWHPGTIGKFARLSLNLNVDVVLNGIKVIQDVWETGYAKKIKVAMGQQVLTLTQNERKEFLWNGKEAGRKLRGKQLSIEILEVHGTMGAFREVQLLGCKGLAPLISIKPDPPRIDIGLILGCLLLLVVLTLLVYFCVTKRNEIYNGLMSLPQTCMDCCKCSSIKTMEFNDCNCLHCTDSSSSGSSSSSASTGRNSRALSVVSKAKGHADTLSIVSKAKSHHLDTASIHSKAKSTSRSASGSRVGAIPSRPASRLSQASRMTRKSVCSKCSRVTEKDIEIIEAMIH